MKTKFFTIPVMDSDAAESALNQFCDQHTIVDIQRHYDSARGIWAVCVIWLAQDGELPKDNKQNSRKPKVDYREVLSAEDFEKFSQLRNRNRNDADNRNRNNGFRFSLAQYRIGITVTDQRLIPCCCLVANKKQGHPHVSRPNERVWDDRFQVSICKH